VKPAIEQFRARHQLPAAAVVQFDETAAFDVEVAGERRRGFEAVGVHDIWHFGSVGKSMTSAMVSFLVAEGRLCWEDKLLDHLPEARGFAYGDVTMAHLLSHRSGIATNPPQWLLLRYLVAGGDPSELSRRMVKGVFGRRPAFRAGTDFLYSNMGYGLAGMIAERVTGTPFKDLVRRFVFEPAGMTTAKFGMPPQDGTAPLEHRWSGLGGKWKAIGHGRRSVDDLPVMWPAGCVSGSIADLATYGRWQIQLFRSARAASPMHTPVGPPPDPPRQWRYAMGWFVDHRQGASSDLRLHHAGSTGGSFAYLSILPGQSRGFAFATNAFRPEWSEPGGPFISDLASCLA
jgi:CubicO group peptidase (beta-lactamase class C family)